MKKLTLLITAFVFFTLLSGCTLIIGNEEAANEAVENAKAEQEAKEEAIPEESAGEYDLNLVNAKMELELVGVDE